jgi:hypothetical protein
MAHGLLLSLQLGVTIRSRSTIDQHLTGTATIDPNQYFQRLGSGVSINFQLNCFTNRSSSVCLAARSIQALRLGHPGQSSSLICDTRSQTFRPCHILLVPPGWFGHNFHLSVVLKHTQQSHFYDTERGKRSRRYYLDEIIALHSRARTSLRYWCMHWISRQCHETFHTSL